MLKRLLIAVAMPLLAGAASAQDPSPAGPEAAPVPSAPTAPAPRKAPLPGTHDGFYFKAGLGSGLLVGQGSLAGSQSGAGWGLTLAAGGAVSRDVLIGVRYLTARTFDSSYQPGRALFGLGPDFTWYTGPGNWFLSLTPAVTRIPDAFNSLGVGLRAGAGKEWWVSAGWGLGLELVYAVSTWQETTSFFLGPTSKTTYTTHWLGLSLSATYN